tara:strand:- start:1159 stop:1482 length:324 start_codon:yes stop_codon:yes gene_type:complete
MAQVIKRENLTIVTGLYKDKQTGEEKKRYRTIGELVTYQNDDSTITQFGEMWGPTGSTKFNVYEQTDRNASQPAQQQQQQYQQAPQQQAPQQQQYQQQPPNYQNQNN